MNNKNSPSGNQEIEVITSTNQDARGNIRGGSVTIRTAPPTEPQYGPPEPEPYVPRWIRNKRGARR
jgi:hypothetical protein